MTDVLEICIIELPKFITYAKKIKSKNLNLWVEFITNPEVGIMVDINDKKSVKETKQAINKAQKKLEKLSQDEHERYLADLRGKYIRDQYSIEKYGYLKGKEDGTTQEKIETAKRLLANNVDISIIITATGLTKEQIEKLI